MACSCPKGPKPNRPCSTDHKIREKCKELVLSISQCQEIMKRFINDVNKGLGKQTHPTSIVKCFVTYVQDLPNGKERGKFLALDLGGTNFRVLLVILDEEKCDIKSKVFAVPQNIMVGTGEQLFDHIANSLAEFIKEENVQDESLPLGFTFSFPVVQKGLTYGVLERWTKGFNCPDVIGKDVVKFLEDSISKRGDIKIEICAVLNDTIGTLMSCAYKDHNSRVGLIVGTGSNACYVEKQKNAELFNVEDEGSGEVLINLEWGAFGDDGTLDFIRTEYDRVVDKHSINPGKQLHEKMISGMYMGELVRLALERFTREGLLFCGKGSDALFTPNSFGAKYVSDIESDSPGTYKNCKKILDELGLKHATDTDYGSVRYVCETVSRRSAHLVSAGIAALLNRINVTPVTVGIDGSVYKFNPNFRNEMIDRIGELVNRHIKFELRLSEDGSGIGAALVAAVAARKRTEK